jgi:hypothetical protein
VVYELILLFLMFSITGYEKSESYTKYSEGIGNQHNISELRVAYLPEDRALSRYLYKRYLAALLLVGCPEWG